MRVVGPHICSACFEAKDEPYVDFEVFWDGPVLVHEDTMAMNPIDDLYLCKPCLQSAAGLVDLGDVEVERAELEKVRAELLELRKDRVDAVRRLDAVEGALTGRQTAKKTPVKPAAKKKVALDA
jgi:hypothetical protein